MAPSDVRTQAVVALKEEISDKPVSIRVSDVTADMVLNDGRFKSQFETGEGGKWSLSDTKARAKAENIGLGVPTDIAPKNRPIYGYIPTQSSDAYRYGAIEIQLHDSVKGRTTITVGDSLSEFSQHRAAGVPLKSPTIEGVGPHAQNLIQRKWEYIPYVEAQIHMGVAIKDINKVILHHRAFDELPIPGVSPGKLKPQYENIAKRFRARGISTELEAFDL